MKLPFSLWEILDELLTHVDKAQKITLKVDF